MTPEHTNTLASLVDAARQTDETFAILKAQALVAGAAADDVEAAETAFYGGYALNEDIIRLYDRQAFVITNIVEALTDIRVGDLDNVRENVRQAVYGLRQMMAHNKLLVARRDLRRKDATQRFAAMLLTTDGNPK